MARSRDAWVRLGSTTQPNARKSTVTTPSTIALAALPAKGTDANSSNKLFNFPTPSKNKTEPPNAPTTAKT